MKKIIDSSMLVKIISMFLAISMLVACKSVKNNSSEYSNSSSIISSSNQSQDNLSSSKESSSSEDTDLSADNNSSFEFDFNDNTEDYIEETVDYSVTVTIMLLLCFLIIKALSKDTKIKELFIYAGKFIMAGALGMVLYYLALTLLLKLTKITLLDYQGFGDAASFSGIDIFASLYTIKKSFFGYFFNF